jgi:hypothetical protein
MRANAIRGCDLCNSKRNGLNPVRMAGVKLLGWPFLEAVSRYTMRRLVSRPLAYSQFDGPYMGWNDFGWVQLSDIRQTEFSDAHGGSVPKICNRVPSHGPTGPTKGKPTNLESPGGAMASLRQAD